MLRVEASNLPIPRGAPRPRRLLPHAPVPRRVEAAPRHEVLPPRDESKPTSAEVAAPTTASRPIGNERWSVKLELGDEEIAKLYGQGMTRGAVVWKKGMVEWRPLLITPELAGLLRRTRVTLSDSLPALSLPSFATATPSDDVALPRPARLPSEPAPQIAEKSPFPSVAPLALDIEPPSRKRRPLELVGVAAAAFALAWLARSQLHSASHDVAPLAATFAAPAPAPACEPPPTPTILASTASNSNIPTVSLADLPVVGSRGAAASEAHAAGSGSRRGRASASSSGGPSRSELVAALSRVAGAASGCGERGGPVRVVMSFSNSGVARSISVSGANLPAATRSCIISAASRARVPAFTGDPVTVAKSL